MEYGYPESEKVGDTRQSQTEAERMKFLKDRASANNPSGHKRSLSGSILSKLSFLRTSQTEEEPTSPPVSAKDVPERSPAEAPFDQDEGRVAAIQRHKQTRKRKGSLRKIALLGTGKSPFEGRERRGSQLDQVSTTYESLRASANSHAENDMRSHDGALPPAALPISQSSFGISTLLQSKEHHRNGFILPAAKEAMTSQPQGLVSPDASSTHGDTSTTDDDDVITFPRASGSATAVPPTKKPSSGKESYFPLFSDVGTRRRSSNKAKSPLGMLASDPSSPSEEWDYSDTEWWGWVVLIVTWLVFVVGMGSCLGVWSWAWDVGETPYAPPELEDDPTLPIVGYYPALIILTAVMAWVWVVVAWVGMKYFRHAKISGEDV